jgi:hypothetical protein
MSGIEIGLLILAAGGWAVAAIAIWAAIGQADRIDDLLTWGDDWRQSCELWRDATNRANARVDELTSLWATVEDLDDEGRADLILIGRGCNQWPHAESPERLLGDSLCDGALDTCDAHASR